MAEIVKSLKITVTIQGTVTGDDGAKLNVFEKYERSFADGTAANQVGNVWQDVERPLNATSEDLDLNGLLDFQGVATGFNNLKMMYLRNLDTDTGDGLTVGGAAANQFINWVGAPADKVKIGPGGIMLILSPVDGYGITAGTGDLLKVETDDNSNYRIIVAGDNS